MEAGVEVGEYKLQMLVGQGSFAKVFRAAHRRTGARVAVKAIDRRRVDRLDKRAHAGILKEREILKSIDHPNILRLIDTIDTTDMMYLILEYCDGGDLDAFLQKHGRLPVATAKDLMRQLAEGLKVLRERNIVHRDLKPQNLLLSMNDGAIILKIGDFGFAKHENLAATICGSPYYMAPEIWQGKDYDAKLVTGEVPYKGATCFQLHQNVLASDELNFPSELEADLCPDCIDLCRRLLHRDPRMRISFEEFFNHKFLATTRKCDLIRESHHAVDTCQTIVSPVVLKTKSESVESKKSKGTLRYIFESYSESANAEDRRGKPPDCFTMLHMLNQYVLILTELAREKSSKGLYLEALSIELVLLAIWKEALDACNLFMDASDDGNFSKSSPEHFLPKSDHSSLNVVRGLDFSRPVSVRSWVESGFMKAYDRAEKISQILRKSYDNTEMPDAMDVIFQTALEYGKSGAANEVLGHRSRSMALYSKSIILLTFILQEAPMLPLNPPFSLPPSGQQRIHSYIANLKSHLCSVQVAGQQQRSVHN
ncbi:Serine/threonine-protein kinase ATG1a [Dichanthelium oligosanthes]|uniref:Serine/threonine-protein kinase ATG1a n=1 Tax=Dichanthelium oligosanthes TaxID=888268 RepID=A0A1E5VVL2_9POAL|nr:Serine/threonine-protein kinase ATG1a [Dichanthelium oligosanthes]